MFRFLSRLVSFRSKPVATKDQDAKAWLDDLRQNELSISARRRIAPDEPVKTPGIGPAVFAM
jgi:hypothetical protein